MNKKKKIDGYRMIMAAEIYNQDPNNEMFKGWRKEALDGIKLLAKAVQGAKDRGDIQKEDDLIEDSNFYGE